MADTPPSQAICALLAATALSVAGCPSDGDSDETGADAACVEGRTVACPCPDGSESYQVCTPDQTWGSCRCDSGGRDAAGEVGAPSDTDRRPDVVDADDTTAPPDGDVDETDADGTTDPGAKFLYTDESLLEAVRDKVEAGEAPWKTAFDAFRSRAERALSADPKSVTDDDGKNRFQSTDDRFDYQVAIDMGNWIRNLGLAYQLTGADKYAREAVDKIHHWFIRSESRMIPAARPEGGTQFTAIVIYITHPKMLYGATMVREHPYWDDKVGDTAMNDWVRTYLEKVKEHKSWSCRNNIYAWDLQNQAAAAAFLGDGEELQRVFDEWREHVFEQVDAEGFLECEKGRKDGYEYTFYGLKAIMGTAEIAHTHGVDLYAYDDPDDPWSGSTVKHLLDHHVQYVQDPQSWEWGFGDNGLQQVEIREEALPVYELGYRHWQESVYLDAIQSQGGRPVRSRRILGPVTLTHGNAFEL